MTCQRGGNKGRVGGSPGEPPTLPHVQKNNCHSEWSPDLSGRNEESQRAEQILKNKVSIRMNPSLEEEMRYHSSYYRNKIIDA